MGLFQSIFKARDKPKDLGGGTSFLWGGSSSGKVVNERTAMQMTQRFTLASVYYPKQSRVCPCLYINTATTAARTNISTTRCGVCCTMNQTRK